MARILAYLEEGTRVRLTNERHEWLSDEPIDDGGTDDGPTPYELLLGSLAACTAITIRLYARHKAIDVAWIRLAYTFDRDVIVDTVPFAELITAHVTIGGEFDDAQRARLGQIVSRCPVHKTLANGVRIIDEVAFEHTSDSAVA
jgi:putative redox protein